MYVEDDSLIALAKPDGWPQERALEVLEPHDDVHASLAGYAELLVLKSDPEAHERAVLTAAVLAAEHGFRPFDAIHAGVASTGGERVCLSDRAYDAVDLDRVPLEPDAG